jgi:hypothetical protein
MNGMPVVAVRVCRACFVPFRPVVGPEWVAWLADLARIRFHAAA